MNDATLAKKWLDHFFVWKYIFGYGVEDRAGFSSSVTQLFPHLLPLQQQYLVVLWLRTPSHMTHTLYSKATLAHSENYLDVYFRKNNCIKYEY